MTESSKSTMTREQFDAILELLREAYKSMPHVKASSQKLCRLASVLARKEYPHLLCHFFADMSDVEHPKISIKQEVRPENTPYHDMKNHLMERYGNTLGLFLANRLASMITRVGKPACIDNLRIARVGYTSSMIEYEARRKRGCCGSCDQDFVFTRRIIGKFGPKSTWKIGFNYGH
jgi:hypothetical protein